MKLPDNYRGPVVALFWNIDVSTSTTPSIVVMDVTSAGKYGFGAEFVSRGSYYEDYELDYRDDLDTYYHQSDDGDRDYTALRVICIGEEVPSNLPLIDEVELKNSASKFSPFVTDAMLQGFIEASDATWALRVINSTVWMHHLWESNNQNIDAAIKQFLVNSLGLTVNIDADESAAEESDPDQKIVYMFYYDEDNDDSRENWSVFYTNCEAFETEELRTERYNFLCKKFTSNIRFHFVDMVVQNTLSQEVNEEYTYDEDLIETTELSEEEVAEQKVMNTHAGVSEPSDVYFYIDYDIDTIEPDNGMVPYIILMRKDEFDGGNTLLSERSHVYVDLPADFKNISDATWQYNGLKSSATKVLLEMGFAQSDDFDTATSEWFNL